MPEIELTAGFRRALSLLESGESPIFVTGGAGTGKSTLIHHIRSTVDKQTAVTAPTGVAALNVRGVTLHSLFRLPLTVVRGEDIKKVRDKSLYHKLELLIIDEISMVRPDVLDGVDRFLRLNRDNMLPFGGLQVLLVGDLFQLPPVVRRNEGSVLAMMEYENEFFFSAHCLADLAIHTVMLRRVFRQGDADFVSLLNDIRTGRNTGTALGVINHRAGEAQSGEPIVLTATNAAADEINSREMAGLGGPEAMYEGEITGDFAMERNRLPAPMKLILKKGARVMFTKNDPGRRWVNGSMGVVEELHQDHAVVRLRDEGLRSSHDVEPVSWEQYKYAYDPWTAKVEPEVKGRYRQLPLIPAWAVTIHKAQGKTLPGVLVDFGHSAFAPGQVYVALSRVRSLDDLALKRPVRPHEVRVSPCVRAFYRTLEAVGEKGLLRPGEIFPVKETPSDQSGYPGPLFPSHSEGNLTRLSPQCGQEYPDFEIPAAVEAIFKDDRERELLKKYGVKLTKLMNGEIYPRTRREVNFVRVCRGQLRPESELELLWERYKLRMGWEGES